jgi:hypothetical protein
MVIVIDCVESAQGNTQPPRDHEALHKPYTTPQQLVTIVNL